MSVLSTNAIEATNKALAEHLQGFELFRKAPTIMNMNARVAYSLAAIVEVYIPAEFDEVAHISCVFEEITAMITKTRLFQREMKNALSSANLEIEELKARVAQLNKLAHENQEYRTHFEIEYKLRHGEVR